MRNTRETEQKQGSGRSCVSLFLIGGVPAAGILHVHFRSSEAFAGVVALKEFCLISENKAVDRGCLPHGNVADQMHGITQGAHHVIGIQDIDFDLHGELLSYMAYIFIIW